MRPEELLEHMHHETRAAIDELDQLRDRIAKLNQVPERDIERAMMQVDMPLSSAARACSKLNEARYRINRHLGNAMAEIEVVRDIADDAIGRTGRLL
jgi:hypothetical protein